MQRPKNRQEARLQDLIVSAKRLNIHVRMEKLLREILIESPQRFWLRFWPRE